MITEKLVLVSVFSLLLFLYGSALLYFKFGWFKSLYHNVLRWHRPNDNEWSDGVNNHAVCKYCNKDILQDSQGNWFTYD